MLTHEGYHKCKECAWIGHFWFMSSAFFWLCEHVHQLDLWSYQDLPNLLQDWLSPIYLPWKLTAMNSFVFWCSHPVLKLWSFTFWLSTSVAADSLEWIWKPALVECSAEKNESFQIGQQFMVSQLCRFVPIYLSFGSHLRPPNARCGTIAMKSHNGGRFRSALASHFKTYQNWRRIERIFIIDHNFNFAPKQLPFVICPYFVA